MDARVPPRETLLLHARPRHTLLPRRRMDPDEHRRRLQPRELQPRRPGGLRRRRGRRVPPRAGEPPPGAVRGRHGRRPLGEEPGRRPRRREVDQGPRRSRAVLPLRRELRGQHRLQHRAPADGSEAAAGGNLGRHTESAVHRGEEEDEERIEAGDGSVFPASGYRSAVGASAPGRDGPGPPVLQPIRGWADEAEAEEFGEMLGDRVWGRSVDRSATGICSDAGGAGGAGGGALRRRRISWD